MSRFKRKKAAPQRAGKNRRALFRQRPPCPLIAQGRTDVDYKDLELLARYTYAEGRIVPARITNISAKMQRKLTNAIKIARQLALMPYTEMQQREQRALHPELRGPGGGSGPRERSERGGERGERGDRDRGRARMPSASTPPAQSTQPTQSTQPAEPAAQSDAPTAAPDAATEEK